MLKDIHELQYASEIILKSGTCTANSPLN